MFGDGTMLFADGMVDDAAVVDDAAAGVVEDEGSPEEEGWREGLCEEESSRDLGSLKRVFLLALPSCGIRLRRSLMTA